MELSQEARLAPVEPFGVERIPETKAMIVEVVTELVEERPEKGLELHHLRTLRGAHPERDPNESFLVRLIEAMKLPRLPRGTALQDPDANRGHTESRGEPVDERLRRRLGRCSIATRERGGEARYAFPVPLGMIELDVGDAVALVVDLLLRFGQASVKREGQRPSARLSSEIGLVLERSASREPRLDLVPVAHLSLSELPAKEHFAALPESGEVDEAGVEIF
jgi:hypothetical protein